MSIKTVDKLTFQVTTPVPGWVEMASQRWPAVRLGMSCLAAVVLLSGCGSDRSVARTSDPFLDPESRVASAPVDQEREPGFLARLFTRPGSADTTPADLIESNSAVAEAKVTPPTVNRQPAEPLLRNKAQSGVQHASATLDGHKPNLPSSSRTGQERATTHALHQSTRVKSSPESPQDAQEKARLEAERMIAELDAKLAASRQASQTAHTQKSSATTAQVEFLPAPREQRVEAPRQAAPRILAQKPEPPRQAAPIDPALRIQDRFTWKSLESEFQDPGEATNDRSTDDRWTGD